MIALDTNVLVFGVQQAGQADLVQRAKALIEAITDRGPAIIPAIAVAEYLCWFPADQQAAQKAALTKTGMVVVPFDYRAATICAELMSRDDVRAAKAAAKQAGSSWQCVKADVMIVATAIAHGARQLITHNFDEFDAIARGRITISRIPETSVQLSMMFPTGP